MKLFQTLAALALLAAASGLHAAATPTPSPTYCLTPSPGQATNLASGCYAATNTLSYNANLPFSADILVVRIANSNGATLPSAITYAGQNLVFIRSDPTLSGGNLAAYYLMSPPTGSGPLVIAYASAGCNWYVTAESHYNVDMASPIGNSSSSSGNASSFSTTVNATRPGSFLADFIDFGSAVSVTTSGFAEPLTPTCCDFYYGSYEGGSFVNPGPTGFSYTLSAASQYTDQLIEIRGVDCSASGSPTLTPPPATASNQLQVFPNLLRGPGGGAQVLLYSPAGGDLQVRIIRSSGRGLRNLWTGKLGAGASQTLTWDGRDDAGQEVGSGVYFVVFIDGNGTKSLKKVLVIR